MKNRIDWLKKIQTKLSPNYEKVIEINTIAGVDVAYSKKFAICVCTVFKFENMEYIGKTVGYTRIKSPYISSYFYLREGKVLEKCIRRCKRRFNPDVYLIDGAGILHPRKLGIASQIGINLDISTIGITKNRLVGIIKKQENNIAPVIYDSKIMGYAIWKNSKKPIFVSIGNKISKKDMIKIVIKSQKYKVPEPIRKAHQIATMLRNEIKDDAC